MSSFDTGYLCGIVRIPSYLNCSKSVVHVHDLKQLRQIVLHCTDLYPKLCCYLSVGQTLRYAIQHLELSMAQREGDTSRRQSSRFRFEGRLARLGCVASVIGGCSCQADATPRSSAPRRGRRTTISRATRLHLSGSRALVPSVADGARRFGVVIVHLAPTSCHCRYGPQAETKRIDVRFFALDIGTRWPIAVGRGELLPTTR